MRSRNRYNAKRFASAASVPCACGIADEGAGGQKPPVSIPCRRRRLPPPFQPCADGAAAPVGSRLRPEVEGRVLGVVRVRPDAVSGADLALRAQRAGGARVGAADRPSKPEGQRSREPGDDGEAGAEPGADGRWRESDVDARKKKAGWDDGSSCRNSSVPQQASQRLSKPTKSRRDSHALPPSPNLSATSVMADIDRGRLIRGALSLRFPPLQRHRSNLRPRRRTSPESGGL